MPRLNLMLATVMVVLSAAVILSTLSLRRALQASRAENAQLKAADQMQEREIAELKKTLNDERASRPGKTAALPPGAPTPKVRDKRSPAEEARAAQLARRIMTQIYGRGLGSLQLAPEKLAALKRLLLEMNLSGSDLYDAAHAAGVEFDSPAFRAFAEKAQKESEAEIVALIGNDNWQKLQTAAGDSLYQQSVHDGIGYDFLDAGVPLSPGQEEALAHAMADAQKTGSPLAPHPSGYYAVDPSTGLKPADQAVLTKAVDVLTPAQLQVLRDDLLMDNRESADAEKGGPEELGFSTMVSIETAHVISVSPSAEHD